MKIALLNDTHCGVRNSSDIFIDYQEQFYNEIFFPYLKEHNIDKIIHLGDYYDNRKNINLKALHRNRKHFLEVIRSEGIHMDIFPGNHDTFFKNTNDLNSLKELLGYYVDEVNIHMEPTVVEYGSMKIALIPWLNEENEDDTLKFLAECDADVVMGHFEFSGYEVLKGVEHKHGLNPSCVGRFDAVYSGHFHTKSSKGNITYLGSQMEFMAGDANDPKYFHILDTETGELESVRNPLTIFEKVYYDDAKTDYSNYNFDSLQDKFVRVIVINKSDQSKFDAFIDGIQSTKIHELKISENFAEFTGSNIKDDQVSVDDTQTLLDSYIDAVDTSLDKDRIKREISALMVEAQSMEIA
jgi:3',5'-cyclic AMP phosphodiesterase CpdA